MPTKAGIPISAPMRKLLAAAVASHGGQQAVADRVGISQAMLSRILSGDKRASAATMRKICGTLGFSFAARTVVDIAPRSKPNA